MAQTQPYELLEAKLSEYHRSKNAAFIGYLPAGFPTKEVSTQAFVSLAHAGADVIEIGLPYSDPSMDGPLIAKATTKALAEGFRVADVFAMVEAARHAGALPVIMTYYNLILRYGVENFARDFAAAGGIGLVTPDLIPEEAGEWIQASEHYGLARIFLVAQSSPAERLRLTAQASRGFVYAASTMGVTGTRESLDSRARSLVESTYAAGASHVALGIGVSTPEQAADVASYADGVIVGSALVRALENDGIAGLSAVASSLAHAVHP